MGTKLKSTVLSLKSVQYKNILKNITFTLEENSINVLIGPNVCGKTTLVKCILGLLDYKGTIEYNGNKLQITKEIGVYSSFLGLLEKNVFDNLMFPLINLGEEEKCAKKKVYDITKKLLIDDILNTNVEELSNIQKKKVLLALSLIHNPKLLIIDDCLDEFNPSYKERVINYLKKISSECTILFLTSRSDNIMCADKIIVVNDGETKFEGDLSQIIKDEKLLINNGIALPQVVDLSNKLKSYELINEPVFDIDKMVNEIWQERE